MHIQTVNVNMFLCDRHGGGALRQGAGFASAGYVRQESDLQDRRR